MILTYSPKTQKKNFFWKSQVSLGTLLMGVFSTICPTLGGSSKWEVLERGWTERVWSRGCITSQQYRYVRLDYQGFYALGEWTDCAVKWKQLFWASKHSKENYYPTTLRRVHFPHFYLVSQCYDNYLCYASSLFPNFLGRNFKMQSSELGVFMFFRSQQIPTV